MKSLTLVSFCVVVAVAAASLTPNTYLSDAERARFKELLAVSAPFTSQNLVNLYYSTVGLNVISNENLIAAIPAKDRDQLCSLLKTVVNEANNLENLFFATSAAKLISCQVRS